jgi:hypothetical protein
MSNLELKQESSWLIIKDQVDLIKKAGLLPASMTSEQATVIALKGREMGIGIMRSLDGMYVVHGKVSFDAKLIMGLIRERCPQAKITVKRKDDTGCSIIAERPGQAPETFTFDKDDANRVGLLQKEMWKKYPSNMFWARAVTEMGRQYFSDVLQGSVYTSEELGGEFIAEVNSKNMAPTEVQTTGFAQIPNRPSLSTDVSDRPSIEAGNNANNKQSVSPKGAKVSSLNDRLQPSEASLAVTSKPQSKPEVVDVATGEVQDDFPAFNEFEEKLPDFKPESKPEPSITHWDRLASSGPNSGKTLRQIFTEVGKDNFVKMFETSTKKIAQMNKEGKPIPDNTMKTYVDLEACCEELLGGSNVI